MNERIRELLLSENDEDVELGLIIAKRENVDIKEVAECYVDNFYNRGKRNISQYILPFRKYMISGKTDTIRTTPNGGEYTWLYYKWKEDE